MTQQDTADTKKVSQVAAEMIKQDTAAATASMDEDLDKDLDQMLNSVTGNEGGGKTTHETETQSLSMDHDIDDSAADKLSESKHLDIDSVSDREVGAGTSFLDVSLDQKASEGNKIQGHTITKFKHVNSGSANATATVAQNEHRAAAPMFSSSFLQKVQVRSLKKRRSEVEDSQNAVTVTGDTDLSKSNAVAKEESIVDSDLLADSESDAAENGREHMKSVGKAKNVLAAQSMLAGIGMIR